MIVVPTSLDGLFEIASAPIADNRGRFTRLFCEDELATIRPSIHFTQINLSETTRAGTVRGLHYQKPPAAEAKLIRCLRGRVFDVAVDLRAGSATFLLWHAVELSGENGKSIFIPEGFAHGFQALSDDVQLLYMHTTAWTPANEAGILHDDLMISIPWPLAVTSISEKDRCYKPIDPSYGGVHP
ncbi:MAG: dTDP-4-dehydrorhamnose 3,5-epimerase family protein [Dokdonella sp.]|uniref:dTDP-4-dehydrorhamnose 3,5-epimerase family protein n=1 Tax=Dokdonella sp. TaxID=2291710 RepID=UPI003263EA37